MSRPRPPARNNREDPNIFGSTAGKPSTKAREGKYRNIMRVGGRKVSSAPPNKVRYNFPVEIRYIKTGTEIV